jgi:FdhD protein
LKPARLPPTILVPLRGSPNERMIEAGARQGPSVETRVVGYEDGTRATRFDRVATEEPLEIRLRAAQETRTVAITMRTPGHDFELAAGFLHNEGVLAERAALRGITYCLAGEVDEEQRYNIVNVDLSANRLPPLDGLERHFTTTSACGVCGKANLEALRLRGLVPLRPEWKVAAPTLLALPQRLREAQRLFETTGGLHAAGLFDRDGRLTLSREDVGRHNAVDKLTGWAFLNGRLPLEDSILMVSGRTSFEIVQKALAAGIPLVCAVSAPSSLAVDLAREYGIALVGFLRDQRFNVYAHEDRIAFD